MPPRKRDDTCAKCGKPHPRCAGHNRAGNPCGRVALANQAVCPNHGGRSPQALVGAASRALDIEARRVLAERWAVEGEQPVEDPLRELARLAGEIVGWKDYLRGKVTDLDGALAYWIDRDYVGADGEILRSEAAEQLRAVVIAYERAQDRAAKALGDMVKLDIAGRMASVREQQAVVIVAAVRAGLGALDFLTGEQRAAALSAVAEQLESIAEPDVIPAELVG